MKHVFKAGDKIHITGRKYPDARPYLIGKTFTIISVHEILEGEDCVLRVSADPLFTDTGESVDGLSYDEINNIVDIQGFKATLFIGTSITFFNLVYEQIEFDF